MPRLEVISVFVLSIIILFVICVKNVSGTQDDSEITLTILFNEIVTSPNAGKHLIDNAIKVLENETDAAIKVNYVEFQSDNSTRDEIIRLLSNQTPIDIITVDQIWLGELAQKGLLTDPQITLHNGGIETEMRSGTSEIGKVESHKEEFTVYGLGPT